MWLVLLDRRDGAIEVLERVLSLRNDVGLPAEEYDVRTGRFAGNFPPAFSHVALVNTVHNLVKTEKPLHQRSVEHRHGPAAGTSVAHKSLAHRGDARAPR